MVLQHSSVGNVYIGIAITGIKLNSNIGISYRAML